MRIGAYELSLHNFGFFRLDGGAMFGSVPKNIWSKKIPVDDENCIPLATRCILLKGKGKVILVDVGLGDKWGEKERGIFAIKTIPFKDAGVVPEDITDVVLTHLHFDHAGGISYIKDGKALLSFPNATIHLQRDNFENAKSPNLRERASYLPDNVDPLEQAKLNLLPGSCEILPGIFGHQVNGHTKGQQFIEIRGGERTILYPTDLIPTSRHLPLPYTMGYDICTETLMKEKESFLNLALERDAIVVFEHDPDVPAATICKDSKGHFAVKEKIAITDS